MLDRNRDASNIFEYTFNVPHLVMPAVHDLIRDRRIPDPVGSVMALNILLWNAGFFVNELHTSDCFGWYQDLRY